MTDGVDMAQEAQQEQDAAVDPVEALQARAEKAEAEASAANSQLLLIVGKLTELNLIPGDEPYQIGELAAEKLAHFHSQCERINAELTTAIAERDKAQLQLAETEKAPKVSPGSKAAKLRAIHAGKVKSPLADRNDAEGNLESVPQQLAELVAAAETVEVVPSDGKNEIEAIGAIRIEGSAWRVSQAGLQLTIEQLLVYGPAMGQAAYEVAGYGLLLDGELVHYTDRGEPIEIQPGATQNIAQDICLR